MNNTQLCLSSINDVFTLTDIELANLKDFVSNSLKNKFQFGHDFYTCNDVVPTSLVAALAPYFNAGLSITSDLVDLEARYHDSKFQFEFEISLSFEGMKTLLIEQTSIKTITVNAVYASDTLEIDHATQTIHHNVSGCTDELNGLYTIIELENGRSFLSQLSADEAKQALYANTQERLNGVNPYTTKSKELMCYKLTSLRRALKTISAHRNCGELGLIDTLLSIHNDQFNLANTQRKVMPLQHLKYKCCSKQPSTISKLYKEQCGNTVIPFTLPKSQKNKTPKSNAHLSVFADPDFTQWDSDTLGVGF